MFFICFGIFICILFYCDYLRESAVFIGEYPLGDILAYGLVFLIVDVFLIFFIKKYVVDKSSETLILVLMCGVGCVLFGLAVFFAASDLKNGPRTEVLEQAEVTQVKVSSRYGAGHYEPALKGTMEDGKVIVLRVHGEKREEKMKDVLIKAPELEVDKFWISADVRAKREDKRWLNIVLRKQF